MFFDLNNLLWLIEFKIKLLLSLLRIISSTKLKGILKVSSENLLGNWNDDLICICDYGTSYRYIFFKCEPNNYKLPKSA